MRLIVRAFPVLRAARTDRSAAACDAGITRHGVLRYHPTRQEYTGVVLRGLDDLSFDNGVHWPG